MGEVRKIIILGGKGFAGTMHANAYRRVGWKTYVVDPADGREPNLPASLWEDAIVDVCTPTAIHAESVVDAYERGARRFVVEKPQANSDTEWAQLLALVPHASLHSVHNYLWSDAFEIARTSLGPVSEIECAFDKDRSDDDRSGRGAHRGSLAPVLHVEAPHQFAMALAIDPTLRVTEARIIDDAPATPTTGREQRSALVRLASRSGTVATISTNLRAPRRRHLKLTDENGRRADVGFANAGLEPASVAVREADGTLHSSWTSPDDALGRNLTDAVNSFELSRAHQFLRPSFSSLILQALDSSHAYSAHLAA